jgi:phytoene/squalene synthetase
MSVTGVVVDGKIELDEPGAFPDGMRVRIGPATPSASEDDWLQELRAAHAESQSTPGRPIRELLKEMAARHGFPLEAGE